MPKAKAVETVRKSTKAAVKLPKFVLLSGGKSYGVFIPAKRVKMRLRLTLPALTLAFVNN
jgi:hypothetical protein